MNVFPIANKTRSGTHIWRWVDHLVNIFKVKVKQNFLAFYDGWSNKVALIKTTPGVHVSVYEYPGLITKQMIETSIQAIWTILNDANIQHCIIANMMYLFHHTSTTDKAWNAIKKNKNHWGKDGG